ncbi:MAG: carboxypeptidase-like regulatory domain-containing protein, partial [Candidatus Neomarinimicrobiota bacterium]
MKKFCVSIMMIFLLTSCTEKIIYEDGGPHSNTGSIVGLVQQFNSSAKVVVRQAVALDSTYIDPADGSFRIDNLPVGNYDISIKADNYGTYWHR